MPDRITSEKIQESIERLKQLVDPGGCNISIKDKNHIIKVLLRLEAAERLAAMACEYTLTPSQSITVRLSLGFPVGAGQGYWYVAQQTGDPLYPLYWNGEAWRLRCPAKFKTASEAIDTYKNVIEGKPWPYIRGYAEVDHLIPLSLGGSNSIKNLWPEPYGAAWGAHQKDDVELAVWKKVCRGTMSLEYAQHMMATDWIALYKQTFHTNTPRRMRRKAYFSPTDRTQ